MLPHVLIRSGAFGFAAGKVVAEVTPANSGNLDGVIVGGVVSVIVAVIGLMGLRRSRQAEAADDLTIRDRVTTVEANLKSLRTEVRSDIKDVKAAVDRIEEHFWKDPT